MPLVHHDTKNLTKSAPAGLSMMLHDAMASLMARFRGDGASVKGAGWTDSARAGTTAPPSPLPRRAAAVQANPTFSPAARRNARASDAGAMTYAEAAGPAAAPVMHALDAEFDLADGDGPFSRQFALPALARRAGRNPGLWQELCAERSDLGCAASWVCHRRCRGDGWDHCDCL